MPWPVFSLRLLVWGELQEGTEDGTGSRVRHTEFLSWERWLLWGDVGKSLVEEGKPEAACAHSCLLGGAASVFSLSKDREGRGMETFMLWQYHGMVEERSWLGVWGGTFTQAFL